MTTEQQLKKTCKNIAYELSNPSAWQKQYAKDNELSKENAENLGAYEWLEDVLDIEYRVGANKSYRSAEVCVGVGGPNIYVDTDSRTVKGYWGSDRITIPYQDELGLNDALEEMWSNIQ